MATEISVSLNILGEDNDLNSLNPEDLTSILEIQPTEIWRLGDLISQRAIVRRKQNGWSLKAPVETEDLEEQIRSLLEILKSKWSLLVEISSRYYTEMDCVIYIYGDDRPAIYLSQDIIKSFAELNVNFGIDLFILPER